VVLVKVVLVDLEVVFKEVLVEEVEVEQVPNELQTQIHLPNFKKSKNKLNFQTRFIKLNVKWQWYLTNLFLKKLNGVLIVFVLFTESTSSKTRRN
jgi:hypothetical protein